jgi:ribosomal-protein-alanine N-acetyltransferase
MTVSLPVRLANLVSLSPSERRAVEGLIGRCAIHDGFDPGLHFDTHLNADHAMPAWRVAWARAKETHEPFGTAAEPASTMIGAACVFSPSRQEGEITACVDPLYRHQGVGRNLYDGMRSVLKEAGVGSVLLACNTEFSTAAAMASRFSAKPDHAEYRMTLPASGLAAIQPPDSVRLTPVNSASLEEFIKLSAAVFGDGDRDRADFARSMLDDPDREQFMAHTANGAVGTVAMGRDGAGYMINGLGILPELRGRGLGGAILDSCLVVLGRRGAMHIALEVDAGNEPARALYRSRGFVDHGRTEYWRVEP